MPKSAVKKTVFIGTGNIAEAHAEAVAEMPDVSLFGVFDVSAGRAAAFAERFGATERYDSLEAVADDARVDAVHVLTPPPAHHSTCLPLLEAGKAVLVEKPMGVNNSECDDLLARALETQTPLRTNQNFIFHPAQEKMRKAVNANRIGLVRQAQCRYIMPLRQLSVRQFGHWMFSSPLTLLLEQAVHPLSQLDDLMGPLTLEAAIPGAKRAVADGIELVTSWSLSFSSSKGPVQMQFSLGDTYHDWSISLYGDDGRLEADYLSNRVVASSSGAWLEPVEHLRTGLAAGMGQAGEALAEATAYLAAQTGLKKRNDPFFRSMRGSIQNFYQSLDEGRSDFDKADLDGARGARLVGLCEDIVRHAPALSTPATPQAYTPGAVKFDCAVIGGTGFIGAPLTRKIAQSGRKVLAIARNTNNLSSAFSHENIVVAKGSASDKAFLSEALKDIPVIINLAHGGGGANYEEIRDAMVGSAKAVADVALEHKAERLLHVSSIAALYLGEPSATITHATPPDAVPEERGDYARAKVATEHMLFSMQRENALPLALFRPGVVVGEGTSPFHSGVGLYNRERYCLGWNKGRNPLPFVLVEDVADALYQAAFGAESARVIGQSFNLIGDVRLSAHEYTQTLGDETGRPLRFRPQFLMAQQVGEIVKWLIKQVSGRRAPFPSMRDLRSRGMASQFDISFEKDVLDWRPVADRSIFVDKAIKVHKR